MVYKTMHSGKIILPVYEHDGEFVCHLNLTLVISPCSEKKSPVLEKLSQNERTCKHFMHSRTRVAFVLFSLTLKLSRGGVHMDPTFSFRAAARNEKYFVLFFVCAKHHRKK